MVHMPMHIIAQMLLHGRPWWPESQAGDFHEHPVVFIRRCRYQQAELINGRTAMTAVAGILIPSVRGSAVVLR